MLYSKDIKEDFLFDPLATLAGRQLVGRYNKIRSFGQV